MYPFFFIRLNDDWIDWLSLSRSMIFQRQKTRSSFWMIWRNRLRALPTKKRNQISLPCKTTLERKQLLQDLSELFYRMKRCSFYFSTWSAAFRQVKFESPVSVERPLEILKEKFWIWKKSYRCHAFQNNRKCMILQSWDQNRLKKRCFEKWSKCI